MSKQLPAPVARNKAVIYIRVSTQEQVENLSLETQEERCRELCNRKAWPVIHVFREEGQSAKTTRRDQFQRMLRFCKEPKNGVGHIVVYDLSRFARNMLDQLSTEQELLKDGVRVESVLEPTEDTAVGRWARNMKAVTNQYDNELRSERTIAGMTQAAKLGRFPFKAPLGYLNKGGRRGHNLMPDPNTAPLITKAFELFATGSFSKTEVLKQMNSLGLKTNKDRPLPMQTFQKILTNPLYAGWVCIPKWGLKYEGLFEPLVTQRVFDAVQDVLQGRKAVVKAYNNPEFPLRMFVRCGICGDRITGGFSTSKNKKNKHPYYRCRRSGCSLRNIRRDELEAEFLRLIKRLTPEPKLVDELIAVVLNEWNRRQGDAEAACEVVHQRLAKARDRKNKLIDLRLDGEIDERTYREQDEHLTAEIDAAESKLRETESDVLDLEDVLAFARKIVTSPARLWLESSIDQRQKLQLTFFPDGLTFDREKFGTPASSLFFSLLGGISEDQSLLASPTGFEPVLSP